MIYFIRSGQYVKIGVSVDPWGRLATLQTAHHEPLEMLAVAPGEYPEEYELHRRFSQYHQLREWFHDNDVLRQYIAEVRRLHPELQERPRPTPPDPVAPIHPLLFSDETVNRASAYLDNFRQAGGVVEVYEYPDKVIIGLPDTDYKAGYDPTKLYIVNYDDGSITPRIGREMKPRTLTHRLNEAMMHISYFIKPSMFYRDDYGVYLRFDRAAPFPTPTEATP